MTANTSLVGMLGHELTAVHVGMTAEQATVGLATARAEGLQPHYADLSRVRSPADLFASLTAVFQFPTAVVNYDGALDWLADLDWFGNDNGHLIVVDGLNEVRKSAPQVFQAFAQLLPGVLDRMRSSCVFCHIITIGAEPAFVDAVLDELRKANQELEAAASLGWVQDVAAATVINHVERTNAGRPALS